MDSDAEAAAGSRGCRRFRELRRSFLRPFAVVVACGLAAPHQAPDHGLPALPIDCGLGGKAAPTRPSGNVGHDSGLGAEYRAFTDREMVGDSDLAGQHGEIAHGHAARYADL